MRKDLVKILWNHHNKSNLIGASIGMIIGLVVILASFQLFMDVQLKLIQEEQIFKPEFFVINKEISVLNTLKVANSTFSKDEINELENQEFTEKVGKFISNKFKLSAYIDANSKIPGFYTELFFESVEDEYLELNNSQWKWKEGQYEIPIILPKDYLTLYNFGFAQSQGLPQISEDVIGKAVFSLRLSGNGKQAEFKGRIVGFSGKINSILVPYNFLQWANTEFGKDVDESTASRLVVVVKDPTSKAFVDYLNGHSYQSNDKNERLHKIASVLKISVSIVAIIGLAIVLLSVLVFVLSFNIIIAKSSQNIIKLTQLGIHYKIILKIYRGFYIKMLLVVLLISDAILFPIKLYINSAFEMAGFSLETFPNSMVFGLSVLLTIFLFVVNSISLKRNLKNLAN